MLGFDAAFDLTGVDTRAQAKTRATVGVIVFLSGLTAMDWRLMAVWALAFALGDSVLWIATEPRNQQRAPIAFRTLRLAATAVSTCAWVGAGVLWWFSGSASGQAAGIALIAGVLVYMIRGCHKSLAQLLVTATPPTAALLLLPLFETTWRDRLGLLSCTAMLVAYGLSSAARAVKSHVELEKATAALTVKQREAEAASIAKSEFLANMSHEIRTPLNGILAMAHVLAEAPLDPREKEAAQLICSSGQTLERLLSDILDLAKVEAGQVEMEITTFQAGDLARSIAGLGRTQAEAKGLVLAVEVDAAAERFVQGDEVRIRQVLMNLLSNAIKFTPRGAITLSLTTTARGGMMFGVQDTGIGFSSDDSERIFERFQQADGTITRRFGGTGLGLSISRHLVEMMGGTLAHASQVGRGAKFWFELDLPAGVAPAQPAPAELQEPAMLRLLVVDDHPTNLKVVEIIMAGAGVPVTTATNGQEAVDAWRAYDFDLILMDMQMPVMDGLAAVQTIRAGEAASGRRRIPIVMLTANASPAHIRAGAAAGADGHLTKPISATSLFAAIEEALAGAEAEAASDCPKERSLA